MGSWPASTRYLAHDRPDSPPPTMATRFFLAASPFTACGHGTQFAVKVKWNRVFVGMAWVAGELDICGGTGGWRVVRWGLW